MGYTPTFEPGEPYLDLRDLIEAAKTNDEMQVLLEKVAEALWESDMEEAARNEPTLIRETEFVNYAREFAEDIGAVDGNADWPLYHIDWKAAADDLSMDYSEVVIDGYTYLRRDY